LYARDAPALMCPRPACGERAAWVQTGYMGDRIDRRHG
jgi:hypothetical protein